MPAAVCGENGTPGPGVTNGKGNGLGLAAAGAAGGFKERLSPRVEVALYRIRVMRREPMAFG